MEHRNAVELAAGLDEIRSSPADGGTVELIVRRPAENERDVLEEGVLDLDEGLVGDMWHRRGTPNPDAQVTLMNARAADLIAGVASAGRSPATSSTSTSTSASRTCPPARG